jgi:hypothetical protein
MKGRPHPAVRLIALAVLAIPLAFIVWKATGPAKRPDYPRWQTLPKAPPAAAPAVPDRDADLVRQLLGENLSQRTFSFATIAEAASGKKVVPLGASESHRRVTTAIATALDAAILRLNADDSPVRSLRRINEASRFFEDALHAALDAEPDLSCDIPPNRRGEAQRSGYPDLRIIHRPSGEVFYLDPKLVEDGSWTSTLRTFYFEPKNETLKITDDAVHLLIGIGHDGNSSAWQFTGHKLVDLSTLKVRLKAEFQASNADLYPPSP